MEVIEEQKKQNYLSDWVRREADAGFANKTADELLAQEAIKSTANLSYYQNLHAVKAIKQPADRQGVMDSFEAYFNNYSGLLKNYSRSRFMGYSFLSYLAQDAMISRGVRVLADEMTREWGEITCKDKSNEEAITKLYAELDRVNAKEAFKKAAHNTGFFGGCLVFLDIREDPNVPLEDEELAKPLFKEGMAEFNLNKLKGRYFAGLRVIEPINVSPGMYNSTDPTAPDFFEPEHFYVLGKKIHKSRFLYFADNIPPQILKPVYLFFGVPLAQLAFQYVQDFYKAKDVCSRILQKFSCSAISTDIEKLIATNGRNSVKDRVRTIAKYRDNDSILVLDKENEEFSQVNTPLSGLKEMWYANLEQIPMIFETPATKLLEISPSGFNSTGEFEIRSFYDSVHTKQSNQFNSPMKRLLDVLCYILGFDPSAYSWSWKPLYKLTEREAAEVNKIQADTDQVYYNMGVIGNDDIAKRLIEDKDSGYNNIEVPERIDPFAQEENPLEGENGAGNPDETESADITDEFKEGDHPRKKNGQFAEKGSGESNASEKEQNVEKSVLKERQKRLLDAISTLKSGEEVEVKKLRDDLEQYGGSNDITIKYGKNNPETNKGYGIIHIAQKHGSEVVAGVLSALVNGKIARYEKSNQRVFLQHEGYEAILSLVEGNNKKTWLLTGYDIDENLGKKKTLVEDSKSRPTSISTQLMPMRARHQLVASVLDSLADKFDIVKTQYGIKDENPGFLSKLKGLFDADRWITIHPPHGNKEDKGVPLKIGEDGEVKAGAGGRFTGKKINTIKKVKTDNSSTSSKKGISEDARKINSLDKESQNSLADYYQKVKERKEEYAKNGWSSNFYKLQEDMAISKANYYKLKAEKEKLLQESASKKSETIQNSLKDYQKQTQSILDGISSIDDNFMEEVSKKRKEWLEADVKTPEQKVISDRLFNEYAVLKSKAKEKKKELAKAIAEILKKGYKSNFSIKADNVTPKAKTAFNEAKYLLDGFFGENIEQGELNVRARGSVRSYYSHEEHAITIKSDDDFETVVHELGHYLEHNNPDMLINSKAFLEYRTKGETESSLNSILKTRGYGWNEKAKQDKFFSAYCGKVYSDATEIMSMGLQRLFTDPKKFAQEDREYFDFVIANARGEL